MTLLPTRSSWLTRLLVAALLLPAFARAASTVRIINRVGPTQTAEGAYSGVNPVIFTPTGATALAAIAPVRQALEAGNGVTFNTTSSAVGDGDIVIEEGISKADSRNNTTVTFNATRDIVVNAFVYSSGGTLPLVFNAGRNMSVSQVLNSSGANLTLNVTEVIFLVTNMTAGTGQILLQAGILRTENPLTLTASTVSVSSGAALRFNGTVQGNLTVAGNISPGAPTKTSKVQVNGNTTLQSSSTTLVELGGTIAPGINYDQIISTGSMNVGGTLQVTLVDGFDNLITNSDKFTILKGSTRSGTFSGLADGARVTLNSGYGTMRVRYTGTEVYLDDWQPTVTTLSWDPGTSEAGTVSHSFTATRDGPHYLRVVTQATTIGAWRTRLSVTGGTASLYMARGYLPTPTRFQHASTNVGNNGVVLREEEQFSAGETWEIMVNATSGATCTLVTGKVYVNDLGTLPFTDSNTNSRYDIGESISAQTLTATTMPGEGMRFYKVTVPPGVPAWSLWLGGTSYEVAIRQDKLPFHLAPFYDRKQTGQMLVAPPLLDPAATTSRVFYINVAAPAGANVGLDSRIQAVTDLPINGTTTSSLIAVPRYRVYRVNVPANTTGWAVRAASVFGDANLAVRKGSIATEFDNDGLSAAEGSALEQVILMQDELSAGTWYVTVYSTSIVTFDLTSTDNVASVLGSVTFNTGQTTVNSNHAPGTWRYFQTTVPADVLGWDLRLRNVTQGTPQLVVRRNGLPRNVGTGPWIEPASFATWASGNQWAAETDWTGRPYEAGNAESIAARRLVMATGGPLEAGTYFIGIYNAHPTEDALYAVESRGIGAGQAYEVFDLPGITNAALSNIPPHEARYFKVSIPAATASWEFTLQPSAGEMMFSVRRGAIPDFRADSLAAPLQDAPLNQARVQKTGAERYLLLPPEGQNALTAGDYYLAVVSEGTATLPPPEETGAGNSSGTLNSLGPVSITDLGSITTTGTSQAVSLGSAQVRILRFTVPANAPQMELRLDNRVGNPTMSLVSGTRPARPNPVQAGAYGWSGGQATEAVSEFNDRIISITNPPAGTYHLTLRAGEVGGDYPAASATLVLRQVGSGTLNLDPAITGNGFSSTDTRTLLNGQVVRYTVNVPATIGGQPLLGWVVKTTHTQGATRMRVYKASEGPDGAVTLPQNTAVLTAPWLTPGENWILELEAQGATTYTVTSQQATLNRPVWTLPVATNVGFGDSGIDGNGNALPGDQGINIAPGDWHFYAVDVPTGNNGLLRTQLSALGGNPDAFIREDGLPTLDHDGNGIAGGGDVLVHRRMVQTGTEYGNWAPLDGKYDTQLRPGRWYIAVRASGGVTARYRLLATTINVTSLNITTSSVTSQSLAAGDWRYYRVTVPTPASQYWNLTFSEVSGDVALFLRDTLPPGNNQSNLETADLGGGAGLRTWYGDAKNQGPYIPTGFDVPGTYTVETPPVRPGHVYYVGVQARSAAVFNLSMNTSGSTLATPPLVDFYTGSINTTVAAGTSAFYRIPVPADATRMIWKATHPATVELRLEEGTFPGTGGVQHWVSNGANAALNKVISSSVWPWQRGRTFYLRILNGGTTSAAVTLTMDSRNPASADEDLDGLPDAWETTYYADPHDETITSDFDSDGIVNLLEHAFNLNPKVTANITLTAGTGLTGLPRVSVAGQRLRIEYIRRRNTRLIYQPEFISDPFREEWLPATNAPVVTPIDADWERVVVDDTQTVTSSLQRFGRVSVRVPPP